jgi:hypothetical protein
MQLTTALTESEDDPLREIVGALVRRVSRFSIFKRAANKAHTEFVLTGRSRAWLREFFDCMPGVWEIREHKATRELARRGTAEAIYHIVRKDGIETRGTELYRALTRALKLGEKLRADLEILKEFAPALLAVSAMLGETAEAEAINEELDAELDNIASLAGTPAGEHEAETSFAALVAQAESTSDIITLEHAECNDPYGDTNGENF